MKKLTKYTVHANENKPVDVVLLAVDGKEPYISCDKKYFVNPNNKYADEVYLASDVDQILKDLEQQIIELKKLIK